MFLSICIPSYNRFDNLQRIIDSISTAKSNDFDVIIVDNVSNEDISVKIKINDKRVKIIKRNKKIEGPTNVRMTLNYADAEYAMLCLDKDYICGNRIDSFIEQLKKYSKITCGYCELNSRKINSEFVITENIVDSIFCGSHPSGTFFRNDFIIDESEELDLMNENSMYYNNPFLIDLLYAKCACKGEQAIFHGKLIETESLHKAAECKSFSYNSKANNIYFMPDNRVKQFWIYVSRLQNLKVSDEIYDKIIKKLIFKTMWDVSLGYKYIRRNEALCQHHGIVGERITKQEEIYHLQNFVDSLYNNIVPQMTNKRVKSIVYINKIQILARIFLKG